MDAAGPQARPTPRLDVLPLGGRERPGEEAAVVGDGAIGAGVGELRVGHGVLL